MDMIDKSDGNGCIGCPVEKGKTCINCIHRDDIVIECKKGLTGNGTQDDKQDSSMPPKKRHWLYDWGYKPLQL